MSADTAEIEALLSSFADITAAEPSLTMAQVPEAILFGNKATGNAACDLIPKEFLSKLPQPVLDKITAGALGTPIGTPAVYGGVLILGATDNYEILIRLKQYLGTKTYRPLPANLQYIASDGARREWSPKEHSAAIKVTPETAWMLRREMDIYLFAYSTEYAELREFSAERLANGYYPKSTDGIFSLVTRVYEKALKAKDLKLANKIVELLSANSQSLRQVKDYDSTVKRIFQQIVKNQNEVGQILLQPVIDTFEASIVKPEGSNSGSIASPISSTSGLRAPPTQPRCFESEMLNLFASSITSGKLYMANNDGYGTLLSDASIQNQECRERNRDFVFKAGEFFLLDTDICGDSPRNKVFTNSQGQKGSVMLGCVLKVKPGLEYSRASPGPGSITRPIRSRLALVDRVTLDFAFRDRDYEDIGSEPPQGVRDRYRPARALEDRRSIFSRDPRAYRRRSRSPSRE